MVDINESYSAIGKTPNVDIKQKRSFVYKMFFDKSGAPKPLRVVNYSPGLLLCPEEITVVRNFKIKLKKSYIVEQDFVVIPSKSGTVYLPLCELSDFSEKLKSLLAFLRSHNEKQA